MCVQRILGREVYNEREKLSWSIVLATKGLKGFIDDLLNTEEYVSNFGYDTVPYQRRRILPQRAQGDLPFARMARYDEYYRDKLPKVTGYDQFTSFNWSAFMREADWHNVAGVIMLVVAIAVFTLLIGYGVNPMG
jgi:phycobilisome rod-core linker protein